MTSQPPAQRPAFPPAVELIAVAKRYGGYTAVEGLDLTVAHGEVLGFLGPNGAGKTTTIRLLLGFLHPSGGSVRLLGHDMADPPAALAARRVLGFVPDVAGLDPAATGLWLLDELAGLQRRPPVDRAPLLAALDLRPEDLRRPMGRLSRGTRQKINIVQGLQHRPDLIILDEPTEGLDPLAKRALFDLLQAAKAREATIFFSSHVLAEVEELCDRVALIRRGRLVAVDRIADLRAHLHRRVTVQFALPSPTEAPSPAASTGTPPPAAPTAITGPTTGATVAAAPDAALGTAPDAAPGAATSGVTSPAQQLAQCPVVANLAHSDGRWHFTTADPAALLRLLASLPVADITIAPPSLEDVFLQYYRPEGGHRLEGGHRPEEGDVSREDDVSRAGKPEAPPYV
jgi:ABC-2 type transport system ATP-binding protein